METRSVEYKGGMLWSEAWLKLIRAALGFSNIPDGGWVVFGVREESKGVFQADGLSEEQYKSFRPDDMNDKINRYADPAFSVSVTKGALGGRRFVIVRVLPFAELPTICKRNGGSNNELRQGAIYTRSIHKPETVEVCTQAEMREIVERAVTIGVQKLRTRFPQLLATDDDIKVRFREERGGWD